MHRFMKYSIAKQKLSTLLVLVSSTLISLIPAFFNGYPIVYADTGDYIRSGMELLFPESRPIFYGLLIRVFSLGYSLWFIVFVQSFLLTFVMYSFIKKVFLLDKPKSSILIICAILTYASAMGWYNSQVMPDIFTPISMLALAILLFARSLTTIDRIIYSVILVSAILMHFSNVLIILGLCGLALLYAGVLFYQKNKQYPLSKKPLLPLLLVFVSISITSCSYYMNGDSIRVSKGGHAFIMGRLLDSGLLEEYLHENCDNQSFNLCTYKDSLPASSRVLHWDKNSPMRAIGGWKDSEKEYWHLIAEFFKSPKYASLYVIESVKVTFCQLAQIDAGSGIVSSWYADPTSPPYSNIKKHFPQELNTYKFSRQNTNLWGQTLSIETSNATHFLLTVASAFFCLLLLIRGRRTILTDQQHALLIFILIALILNAFVTANFSVVCDRLQARVVWLLPFFALCVLFKIDLRAWISKFLKG
jgi:hypothetical protein